MTSSTSSSEARINHTGRDDRQRYHARRAIALKTILLGGGVMLVAMWMVNSLVSFARSQVPSPFSIQRIQTAAEALPAALALPADDTRQVIYVFGSSLVEFGFSPQQFDAELKAKGVDAVSYNFGFGNSDPHIQERFATRFADLFRHQPDKVDRVIYEFAPFQATRLRAQQSGKLEHAAAAVIGDWRDFLAVAKDDHELAVSLFNTKYVRNGVPAEAITSLLSMPLKNIGKPASEIIEDATPPTGELQMEFFRHMHHDWFQNDAPGGWRQADRGGLPTSASAETMALAKQLMPRLQHPQRMQRALERRIACCDIEDLDIDEAMLDSFIEAVKQAQSVSRQVDVLIMPRNDDVVRISDTGKQRLQVSLERIRNETGAHVVDLGDAPNYGVEWFFDTDHLTLFEGRLRFSRELADHYIESGLISVKNGSLR